MRNFFPYLVILWVLISFVSAIVKAAKAKEAAPEASETEEQKRMREIQERIRRKIAERRGGAAPVAPAAPPPLVQADTPRPRPTLSAPPPIEQPLDDPLTEAMRRFMGEATPKRAVAEVRTPPEEDAAILARQEQLAAQMRTLEAARLAAEKRATQIAAATSTRAAAPAAVRGALLDDLRKAESLRRAIVLREVLGEPVGLR